jgi:hypothetical protein
MLQRVRLRETSQTKMTRRQMVCCDQTAQHSALAHTGERACTRKGPAMLCVRSWFGSDLSVFALWDQVRW